MTGAAAAAAEAYPLRMSGEPTVTYEIVGDNELKVETYPNGTKITRHHKKVDEPSPALYPTLVKVVKMPGPNEDKCRSCGVTDVRVLPGLGYYHRECYVAETEKRDREPRPTITYEVYGDTRIKVETYPNGTSLRKEAGVASKHEKVVALAKQTYDSVLSITKDHAKACEMMAHTFAAMYGE